MPVNLGVSVRQGVNRSVGKRGVDRIATVDIAKPSLPLWVDPLWESLGANTVSRTLSGWAPIGYADQLGVVGKTYRVQFTVDRITGSPVMEVFRRNVDNTGNDIMARHDLVAGRTYTVDVTTVFVLIGELASWIDSDIFTGQLSGLTITEVI